MMMRRMTRVLAVMVCWVALAAGQTAAPALSGTVTNAGRGLAGVTVRAIPAGGTEVVAATTTGADGTYRLALPPSVYRLEFSADGFTTAVRGGIVVLSSTTSEVNVAIERVDSAMGTTLPDLRDGEVGVRIETKFGFIMLAIDVKRAPITSANFLKYVDAGLYNGGRFHRVTRPDNYTPSLPNRPMMEIIQGGINPGRRAEGFPPIPLERTSVTGLKHVTGTVSMARGTAADTATSDFFILLNDQPSLDFGGKRFDDEQGAAAFGRVIFGLGVVRRIQQQPVKEQSLTPPIPILRAGRY